MSDDNKPMPEKLLEALSGERSSTIRRILEIADPLAIAMRGGGNNEGRDSYGAVPHAELVRFKMLGLSDANAAKAVGIKPSTLKKWTERYPMLQADMNQATQLMNAEVVQLLISFMLEQGPVGLNAVKFWLSTHAEEFKEGAEVTIKTGGQEELARAIKMIYGVEVDGPKQDTSSADSDHSAALPSEAGS